MRKGHFIFVVTICLNTTLCNLLQSRGESSPLEKKIKLSLSRKYSVPLSMYYTYVEMHAIIGQMMPICGLNSGSTNNVYLDICIYLCNIHLTFYWYPMFSNWSKAKMAELLWKIGWTTKIHLKGLLEVEKWAM